MLLHTHLPTLACMRLNMSKGLVDTVKSHRADMGWLSQMRQLRNKIQFVRMNGASSVLLFCLPCHQHHRHSRACACISATTKIGKCCEYEGLIVCYCCLREKKSSVHSDCRGKYFKIKMCGFLLCPST